MALADLEEKCIMIGSAYVTAGHNSSAYALYEVVMTALDKAEDLEPS